MEFFKMFRKHYLPLFLAYVIVSTAVIWIASLYRDPASTTFWRNVGWVELLLFVLWIPFLYMSRPTPARAASRQAPVNLVFLLVVVAYVVVALAVLLYNIFVKDTGNAGVTVQIIAGALALVVGVLLQVTLVQAEAGAERFDSDAEGAPVSPEALAARLKAAEERLGSDPDLAPLRQAYAGLRSELANRLPAVGAITANADYAELCAGVWDLLGKGHPDDAGEVGRRVAAVEGLRSGIGVIVGQLRR